MSEKEKILIADDSAMNRAILTEMLGDGYEILEAENGRQAVSIMQTNVDIDLLLDIMMPEMDGFDVLAMMNKYHWIDDIPVIMISAENASSYVERTYDLGATDYISRPFDMAIVRRRVINTLMLYAKQKRLVRLVAEQVYEKEKSNSTMINILSHIVEFRNGESGLHVLHIQTATDILLRTLVRKTDKYNLNAADISLISTASALHDIGKINIPASILNKPGKLTKEEFDTMKTHTTTGAEILDKLPFQQESPLVKTAYAICRWHHERWDGRGYPDGLKGEDIPIAAQVVAMADVYDALTSERCYKKAFGHDKAMEMILNGECGQCCAPKRISLPKTPAVCSLITARSPAWCGSRPGRWSICRCRKSCICRTKPINPALPSRILIVSVPRCGPRQWTAPTPSYRCCCS